MSMDVPIFLQIYRGSMADHLKRIDADNDQDIQVLKGVPLQSFLCIPDQPAFSCCLKWISQISKSNAYAIAHLIRVGPPSELGTMCNNGLKNDMMRLKINLEDRAVE